jgi:hypothetical protein
MKYIFLYKNLQIWYYDDDDDDDDVNFEILFSPLSHSGNKYCNRNWAQKQMSKWHSY